MNGRMNCPRCTFENDLDSLVCEICGSSLHKRPLDDSTVDEIGNILSFPTNDHVFYASITNQNHTSSSSSSSFLKLDKLTSSRLIQPESSLIESDQKCNRCEVPLTNYDENGGCSVCGQVIIRKKSYSHYTKVPRITCYKCGEVGHYANACPQRLNRLSEEERLKINGGSRYFPSSLAVDGIFELLRKELKSGEHDACYRLCVSIPHISQAGLEGSKWSCGYRNIQMLCCGLMDQECYKSRLFNGKGEVPDINGIQSWIEKAWNDGFDNEGCQQLGGSILGSEKWIGTTECATLLRYFGIDARIVDFEGRFHQDQTLNVQDRLKLWIQRYFDVKRQLSSSSSSSSTTLSQSSNMVGLTMDNSILVLNMDTIDTPRFPIYFQHDGHSRTIIGYELLKPKPKSPPKKIRLSSAKKPSNPNTQSDFKLLVFDPSSDGKTIMYNLIEGNGRWKQQLKRGIHTMTKTAYQIVYVVGILKESERESSKILHSLLDSDDI